MIKRIYVPAAAFLITALVILIGISKSAGNKYLLSRGASHSLYPEFVGVNGNLTTFHLPWKNDSLVWVTQQANIANLRYPAGTIGNTWDWELGWLDREVNDSDLIKWVVEKKLKYSQNRYPIENLAEGYKKTGAVPVLMLNMLSKDLNHSLGALKRLRMLEVPIKYIELGNELYFNLPLEMRRFPTPEEYGKTCKVWIDSIKAEFPGVKCAVIGTTINRKPRHNNWIQRVLKYATNADAITYHVYSPLSFEGKPVSKDFMPGEEGLTAITLKNLSSSERQKWELEQLKNPELFTKILNEIGKAVDDLHKMNLPENMDIWITEFNLRADSSALRGTWANTLALLYFYDRFFEEKKITLTNYHNLVGDLFAAVYTDSLGLKHIQHRSVITKPWTLSSGGLALHLVGEVANGKSEVQKIDFRSRSVLSLNKHRMDQELSGWLFSNGDGIESGLVINFSDKAANIDTRELNKEGLYTIYQTQLSAYIIDLDAINTEIGTISNTLTIPPYSVLLLNCISDTITPK